MANTLLDAAAGVVAPRTSGWIVDTRHHCCGHYFLRFKALNYTSDEMVAAIKARKTFRHGMIFMAMMPNDRLTDEVHEALVARGFTKIGKNVEHSIYTKVGNG